MTRADIRRLIRDARRRGLDRWLNYSGDDPEMMLSQSRCEFDELTTAIQAAVAERDKAWREWLDRHITYWDAIPTYDVDPAPDRESGPPEKADG
jgi:hypothetical protein